MKNSRTIAQGAEAIILLKKNKILKNRIVKSYRHEELDRKIRKSRTKKEAKILEKASKIINVPKIEKQDEFSLTMEYIEGDKLSEKLNSYPIKKREEIMEELGRCIAKIHEGDIIHGDLTTSNMIYSTSSKKLYLIDFGLGFISKRIEDRAVDLHLIKRALEAKHWQIHEILFKNFLIGYNNYKKSKEVLEQLKKVESRGRYKH